MDVLVDVRRSRLQQQHLHVGILAQPAREHAPRRSRTHDHIVIHRMSPLPSLVPLRARPQPAPLLLLVRTCTNVPSLGSPVHDQPAFEPRRSGGCRYSGAARSRRPVPRAARARCAQSVRGSGQRRNSGRRPAGRRHTRAVERWRRLAGPHGRSRRRTRLGDAPARLLPSARLHLLLRARRRQRRRVRRSGRHRWHAGLRLGRGQRHDPAHGARRHEHPCARASLRNVNLPPRPHRRRRSLHALARMFHTGSARVLRRAHRLARGHHRGLPLRRRPTRHAGSRPCHPALLSGAEQSLDA